VTQEVTAALLRAWRPPEPDESASKHDRGTALVVGGSPTTPGAVLLAGLAALRTGAGRLQVATAPEVATALAVALPEALVTTLDDAAGLAERADAVLVGPGLPSGDPTAELVDRVLLAAQGPVAVDAAALARLDPQAHRAAVLTPNDRELEAMGVDGLAEAAARHGAVVAHLGEVVAPDGRRWHDPTGGPELATSGSGDVLAGAVVGLLARGCEPAQAAVWAGHLHARAGARLAARLGPTGLLARELLDELPLAAHELLAGG
jgi:ADP-dependent NAD(P)H-hydrate dehydratase